MASSRLQHSRRAPMLRRFGLVFLLQLTGTYGDGHGVSETLLTKPGTLTESRMPSSYLSNYFPKNYGKLIGSKQNDESNFGPISQEGTERTEVASSDGNQVSKAVKGGLPVVREKNSLAGVSKEHLEVGETLIPVEATVSEIHESSLISTTSGSSDWGWQSKESTSKKYYVCRFSQRGQACGSRSTADFPQWLVCPPEDCCSKTHMLHGQSGNWCTESWALCNGALNYSEYSYGKCTCSTHGNKCPANTECKDEERGALGGVYCKCKDGYIGNGETCVKDLCVDGACYPGTCTMVGTLMKCTCPDGYTLDESSTPNRCKIKDLCATESACGSTEAVKSCTMEGANMYTCDCRLGYTVVNVGGKPKCDSVFNVFTCADRPCGADGVKKCTDSEYGVRCECETGYELIKETASYKCSRQDPCLQNPCGTMDIVKSCVSSGTTYTCECKDGYTVANESSGPYCAIDEGSVTWVHYAASAGALTVLLLAVVACTYKRSGPEIDDAEVNFLEASGGEIAAAVNFSPNMSSWM